MKNTLKLFVTAGLFAGAAAPVFAATVVGDPMTTSCGEYLAQNDTDRLSLAMQYHAYSLISETDKRAVEAMTDAQKTVMIADARAAREALSAEDMAKLTTMANEWMVKINTNCQASGESMVVKAMDAAM